MGVNDPSNWQDNSGASPPFEWNSVFDAVPNQYFMESTSEYVPLPANAAITYIGPTLVGTLSVNWGLVEPALYYDTTGNVLTVSNGAHLVLSGGALPQNVFWQVSGNVSLGTTVQFDGTILCQTGITLGTGASITGRLLAQTAVTLDANTIVAAP